MSKLKINFSQQQNALSTTLANNNTCYYKYLKIDSQTKMAKQIDSQIKMVVNWLWICTRFLSAVNLDRRDSDRLCENGVMCFEGVGVSCIYKWHK